MDRRGENLVRPLDACHRSAYHLVLTFIAVSRKRKQLRPPPVVVIQATELTFAPSAAAELGPEEKADAEEKDVRRQREKSRRKEETTRKRQRGGKES